MTKHKPKRKKRRYQPPPNYSVSKAILDILIDVGEHVTLFASPYDKLKLAHKREWGLPEPPWWRYNRAIKYLEYREHLQVVREGDQLFITLTKKGKLRALMNRLEAGLTHPTVWDGKWRLIIWDIPESSRRERNQIRYFLKELGFYRLQQSVFITPYPLHKAAVSYLHESGLIKFIRFLRVDKIDNDTLLRKHFNLVLGV